MKEEPKDEEVEEEDADKDEDKDDDDLAASSLRTLHLLDEDVRELLLEQEQSSM